ncbi:MAG: DUF2520 domain-containing protein [Dysgonamonadaceae bacterium]|jgi:predicted short-subunit dehydrogenase-like oxidoreductase (DUF2520 family)|nr:DUF2520 domain-containing protein [Dysgonamonadaceae bacterium]
MKPYQETQIVLVGAGSVATQLGMALKEKGFPILQVYSRTLTSAATLGDKLEAAYTHTLRTIDTRGDLYLFSLKDSALPDVITRFPAVKGLVAHTSGSHPMAVFDDSRFARRGVLYPLQTFGKSRTVSFDSLPLFVEANRPEDEDLLEAVASALSDRVFRMTSDRREHLHLAAVFACNFANHLYTLASEYLYDQGLPWELLLPLIRETTDKLADQHPLDAQTGPAIRGDRNILAKHQELLSTNLRRQKLYRLLSRSIRKASRSPQAMERQKIHKNG